MEELEIEELEKLELEIEKHKKELKKKLEELEKELEKKEKLGEWIGKMEKMEK